MPHAEGLVPLACSVRACGLPLARGEHAWVCPRGHAHDVSRSGYLNLLQPQDRRSLEAGDSAETVAARARLLDAGIGRAIIDAIVARVAALPLGPCPVVVELGAGCGGQLAALAASRPMSGIGIDLSTAAARHAARRHPDLTWVVANADRRLPLIDHSVDLVISVHARRNPAECARVLGLSGRLIVALPAPDDLIELRTFIQGAGVERDRMEALVTEHAPWFEPAVRGEARERHRLERPALLDVLRGTYRWGRGSTAARVGALTSLEVTMVSEWVLFSRRPARSGTAM